MLDAVLGSSDALVSKLCEVTNVEMLPVGEKTRARTHKIDKHVYPATLFAASMGFQYLSRARLPCGASLLLS
jgi:hypothetical protein